MCFFSVTLVTNYYKYSGFLTSQPRAKIPVDAECSGGSVENLAFLTSGN